VTRKAWIETDQFDLESVAQHLQSGDATVVYEGDRYYLSSPEIDAAPDDSQANEIVARIIGRINALGRMSDPNFRQVKLSQYTDDSGQSVVGGAMAATLVPVRTRATATVTRADGTVVPDPPSPWPDYLALADKDPVVAEALEIMERPEPLGWDDLWKLFEIIREAVKGDTIVTLSWSSTADLDSFKESANRKDVSGDAARHARRPGQPKHRKMPITEGRSYVSSLVTRWLDSLR
jgi:hypothetical protein